MPECRTATAGHKGRRVLVLLALCSAVWWKGSCADRVHLDYAAASVDASTWYYCGFYGLSFSVQCTDEVDLLLVGQQACMNMTLDTADACAPLDAYKNLFCTDTKWCSGESFAANTDTKLCLAIAPSALVDNDNVTTSVICDISLTVEPSPIPASSSSDKWPTWRIILVAVGSAVGAILLIALLVWALCTCKRRSQPATVTPFLPAPGSPAARVDPGLFGASAPSSPTGVTSPPALAAPYWSVQPPAPVPVQQSLAPGSSTWGGPGLPSPHGPGHLPPLSHPSLAGMAADMQHVPQGAALSPAAGMQSPHGIQPQQLGVPPRVPPWMMAPSAAACAPAAFPTPAVGLGAYNAVPEAAPVANTLPYPTRYYDQQHTQPP